MMKFPFSDKISSLQPSAIREILKATSDPSVISFAAGNPAPEAFPQAEIAAITARVFAENPQAALQYGISEGYAPLISALEKLMHERYNIGRATDRLIITSGATQGIELTAKVLCNEGDVVICENPSFIGALNTFRSYNARLRGIDLEEDGMNLAQLEQALQTEPRARFIYIIANFNNPSGLCTSLAKRHAIYELAQKYGVLILEDNPYGDLRFAGEEIPSFKSFDEDQQVVYVGSFSKIIAPGLRVGWLVAPEAIIAKATVAKQASDVHTSALAQIICERFIATADLDVHFAGLQQIYRQKCALMLAELAQNLPAEVTYTRPQGGLFIWGTLPERIEMMEFCRTAAAQKVAVVPGSAFLANETDHTNSFRLNFSTPTDEEIRRGCAILGRILQ